MSDVQEVLLETLESLMGDLYFVSGNTFVSHENDKTFVYVNNKDYELVMEEGKYFLSKNNVKISLDAVVTKVVHEYKKVDWKKYKEKIKNARLDWKTFYTNVKKKLEQL